MHIAGACTFDGPPPTFDDIEQMVRSKMHLILRYRQRVRSVPFELGRPIWVDDPHFDLRYHLPPPALPAPGDDAALCRLMGRVMSQPLDRDRPLWRRGWSRVRGRSVGAGVQGPPLHGRRHLRCGSAHRPAGHRSESDPSRSNRGRQPLSPALPARCWGHGAGWQPTSPRRPIGSDLLWPIRWMPGDVVGLVAGTARLGRALTATPQSPIDGSIGPHRTWAFSSASFDDVRAVRECGGTVNDIVLTAVTAGYAALLRHRLRTWTERWSARWCPSPRAHQRCGRARQPGVVDAARAAGGVADHLDRLRAIQGRMTELKASHMVEVGEPPPLWATLPADGDRACQPVAGRAPASVPSDPSTR